MDTPEPEDLAREVRPPRKVRGAYATAAPRGKRDPAAEIARYRAISEAVARETAATRDAMAARLDHALAMFQRVHGANVAGWGQP